MSASGTVASPARFGESLRRLRSAQKSNVGAPGYSRWVNRPAGRVLASIANVLGATPNQVTAVSAMFSAAALVLVAVLRPSLGSGLLVTVLLLLGYALDSADGQLARLRGGGSPAGEWLDHIVDCAKTASIHLVVLICWYRYYALHGHTALLLIPMAFTLVSVVWFFAMILTDLLRRTARASTTGSAAASAASATATSLPVPAADGGTAVLRSLVILPADFGVLALVMVFLGFQTVFIVFYSLLLVANALFLTGKLASWFRELNRA